MSEKKPKRKRREIMTRVTISSQVRDLAKQGYSPKEIMNILGAKQDIVYKAYREFQYSNFGDFRDIRKAKTERAIWTILPIHINKIRLKLKEEGDSLSLDEYTLILERLHRMQKDLHKEQLEEVKQLKFLQDIIKGVANIIKRHINDDEILQAIAADFRDLIVKIQNRVGLKIKN